MSLFEDVSTLFAAAITDGQDNEAIVKAAYEDLLGYADADTMNNSAARIDYWVQKLSSGELTTDNFGGSFLEEANTNQGSLISSTTFENNQTVVAAHEDAYEANPDVTLEDLTAVAAENRVEDVAEEDEGVTGETFTLTTSIDDLTGTADDDTFVGDNNTVTAADTVDGGAGNDTLRVVDTNSLPGISNVESLTIEHSNATDTVAIDLSSDDLSDVTTLTLDGFDMAATTTTVKAEDVINLIDAVDTDDGDDFDIDAADDVTAIEIGVNNSGTSSKDLELEANGAGMTDVTVNATGEKSFIDIEEASAGSLETVTLNATADLEITDIDSATTITGEGSTGDLNILSVADDDLTVTMGDGDDRVDFAATLDENDSVDGGAGEDTVVISSAVAAASMATLSNIENAEFDSALDQDLSVFADEGVTTFVYTADSVGADYAPTNNENAFNHIIKGDVNKLDVQAANDSLSNVLNLQLEGTEIDTILGGTSTNFNTVNLTSAGETQNAIENIHVESNATVNVDGSQDLDVLAIDSAMTLNAAELTGDLRVVGTNGQEDLIGGSGDDSFYAQSGGDTLTGGDGADVFLFDTEGDTAANITDFSQGEDKIYFDIGAAKTGANLFDASVKNSNTGGIFTAAQSGNATITVDADGFATNTGGTGTASGVLLNVVNTSGTAANVALTSDGQSSFALGSSLVFTGLTGSSKTALTAAVNDANNSATLKKADWTSSNSFLMLFTTATSGKLFGAINENGDSAVKTGDFAAVSQIATLGSGYSYEAGDIVLM